jgi:hypothetical protein
MTRTKTIVSVNVIAGPIRATDQPRHEKLGQQVAMGEDLYFNLTPETAQQWLPVIQQIANEGINE